MAIVLILFYFCVLFFSCKETLSIYTRAGETPTSSWAMMQVPVILSYLISSNLISLQKKIGMPSNSPIQYNIKASVHHRLVFQGRDEDTGKVSKDPA